LPAPAFLHLILYRYLTNRALINLNKTYPVKYEQAL